MERRSGIDQTLNPEDREGERGDIPGYTPTLKDLYLLEVYRDWAHANPGTHLDGGIGYN